jgi:hypothetical protein
MQRFVNKNDHKIGNQSLHIQNKYSPAYLSDYMKINEKMLTFGICDVTSVLLARNNANRALT